MKIFLLFVTTILVSGILHSCTKFENSNINPSEVNGVRAKLDLSTIPFEYGATLLRGKVSLISTEEELIVNLNEIGYSSDEDLSPRVFVLQQRSKDLKFDSKIMNQEAELLFYKYGLIIEFKDKSLVSGKILLTLGKQKLNKNSAKFLALLPPDYVPSLSKKFYGFGLAKMRISIPDIETFAKDHKQTFYLKDKEYRETEIVSREGESDGGCSDCGTINACTAGGKGTTSCSSNGHSVTCDGDCNACCTGGSAKCCSEETTPEN